jgi:hypothetical protein
MRCVPFRLRRWLASATLAVVAGGLGNAGTPTDQVEKKQILATARQKYYNLRRMGLIEFEANIKPNWQVVADFQSNPDVVKVLDGMSLLIAIDSESKLRMDHRTDLIPVTEKSSDYVKKIFEDMDQAVSRFISTWSVFMLTSPFSPLDSSYEITEFPDRFQFARREGETDVVTLTDKNFKIHEIKVTGAGFNASLKPALKETAAGFMLDGYESKYETSSRETRVEVRLEYQMVNGLQLPRKVNVKTVYDGKPAQIEWLFSDYKVKVR